MSEPSWPRPGPATATAKSLQLCLTLCDPMDCSTPGFPVHHQLLELPQSQTPSSWWCHPTILSSVIPFSSCLQSFPATGSFPMSQFFASGGQVLEFQLYISPSNEYLRITSFRIDRLDLLAVQGTLKCSPTSQLKSINSSALSFLYSPTHTSIHDYWKNHSFD